MYHFKNNWLPLEYLPRAEYWFWADNLVLAIMLISGGWLVFSGRRTLWIHLHLCAALLYFGILKGGCICPVGATANVALGMMHPELVGRATLALFILPLMAALWRGRVFCGSVCPIGAIQQWVSPAKRPPLSASLNHIFAATAVILLAFTIFAVLSGMGFLVCLLDPYKPFFFLGHAITQMLLGLAGLLYQPAPEHTLWIGNAEMWGWFTAALAFGWLVPRFFCRALCPYGVLLGLFSIVAVKKRTLPEETCKKCLKCREVCPVDAIRTNNRVVSVSPYACIQCGNCEENCVGLLSKEKS